MKTKPCDTAGMPPAGMWPRRRKICPPCRFIRTACGFIRTASGFSRTACGFFHGTAALLPVVLALLSAVCAPLRALPVDAAGALRRAAVYFDACPPGETAVCDGAARLCAAADVAVTRCGDAWLFTGTGGAFVLAPSDDALPPVLGYGTSACGPLPPALKAWQADTDFPAYTAYPLLADGPAVAPLLTMTRHQEAPYNALCPRPLQPDGTLGEPCVVGCVATALEEILTYYRRPVVLIDTLHGWDTDRYSIPDLLPGTRIETALIRDSYDADYTPEEADAVARLSYLCGVAARMDWGPDESGASVASLVDPLVRALGMPYVHCLDSYTFRPADWTALLSREIHAGRPVLYTGSIMSVGGHAFVLDGIDDAGLFHVNWGYGGAYDGYFLLDLLCFPEPDYDLTDTGRFYGFHCNQQALLLSPDPVADALPDTLARTGLEIAVEEVRWLQQPESAKYTHLQLLLRNTASETLTTPFEIFTNAPADTAFFEQGDYAALTGCTLRPGETTTLDVHAYFHHTGERVLRLSPDDVHVLAEVPLTVAPGVPSAVSVGQPVLDFPADGTVRATVEVTNAAEAGRAGSYLVLGLHEGHDERTDGETRHFHLVYLAPGGTQTYTSVFRGVEPGCDYTLLVRQPWPIVHRLPFTMPAPEGIVPVEAGAVAEEWLTTDGRRVARPSRPGVYLQRRGREVRKVLVW